MSGEVTADISERKEEISGLVVEIVGKILEQKVKQEGLRVCHCRVNKRQQCY